MAPTKMRAMHYDAYGKGAADLKEVSKTKECFVDLKRSTRLFVVKPQLQRQKNLQGSVNGTFGSFSRFCRRR